MQKTIAVVLKTYKYSETSIIAKMYTEKYGLLSFMVHGVRKKKSKYPAAFFQPLQMLNLEIRYKEKSNLHSIKDMSLATGMYEIQSDIIKSSIALFLAEVLFKTIKEEEANNKLYEFIFNSISFLEEADTEAITNFHLVFLIGLSRHLGFYPNNNYHEMAQYFNLESGEFESRYIEQIYLDVNLSFILHELMATNYVNMHQAKLKLADRRQLLKALITFYQHQLPEMGSIQSLDVLETVFG